MCAGLGHPRVRLGLLSQMRRDYLQRDPLGTRHPPAGPRLFDWSAHWSARRPTPPPFAAPPRLPDPEPHGALPGNSPDRPSPSSHPGQLPAGLAPTRTWHLPGLVNPARPSLLTAHTAPHPTHTYIAPRSGVPGLSAVPWSPLRATSGRPQAPAPVSAQPIGLASPQAGQEGNLGFYRCLGARHRLTGLRWPLRPGNFLSP